MKQILLFALLFFAFEFSAQAQTVTVINERANLRGTPSTSGEVVAEVKSGETFELLKIKGAWYLVQTPRFVGWLHGNTIKLAGQGETFSHAAEPSPAAPRRSSRTASEPSIPTYTPSNSRSYIRGPRGGCYYYSGSGRKVYVDRSLCN